MQEGYEDDWERKLHKKFIFPKGSGKNMLTTRCHKMGSGPPDRILLPDMEIVAGTAGTAAESLSQE